MTKAEARQIIADWLAVSEGEKGQCGYIEGWFYEKDVEAFNMAIEALEQEPSEDCISRGEVLRAIITCDTVGTDLTYLHEVIENMESIIPSKATDKWIHVKWHKITDEERERDKE